MEASTGPLSLPHPPPQPSLENIKTKLLKHGIQPTPKILHTIRKKELQKSNRRLAKETSKQPPPLTDTQQQAIEEEAHFQTIKSEYKKFSKSIHHDENKKMVGRPWERPEKLQLRQLANESMEYSGEKLNPERLRELSDIIESERVKFSWLLDNDVEFDEVWFENEGRRWAPPKRSEAEAIRLLIDRLSAAEMSVNDWKFIRIMRHSGLQFTEAQMLKIVEGLGDRGKWKHALSVVEWVYGSKEHRHYKSRFVYTKLLAVLGRARKPREALRVFNLMRGDVHIYPDMAAYHSLAVTLGQSGLLKELLNVIESMKEKPRKIRNMRRKNWDPVLRPDIVIFNAVLNACVSTCQWKGVSWVFQQLRKSGLRPNGASYGLAMEVMLESGKYDLVYMYFEKMKRTGEALKSLTYKVLLKAFLKEGKSNEAVQAVRDMERRGVVGTASVYYELARCLCFFGRWQEAILEIENLEKLRPARPLAVTFTGMILSAMDGGHVDDCVCIYEHSKTLMAPDIGIINAMLKVYGRHDMFSKAKKLFEEIKQSELGSERDMTGHVSSPRPDAYTFSSMLEASASALQWEYFEYVYQEMTLCDYQLNQRKHSKLLVEASRSGKPHLLEHAFDSLLEAGEIPPLSFFTEMACQAIAQHDYERSVNIINTMAHAPFQVSFQQWIDLFETNGDRIDQVGLNELRKTLCNHDLVQEPTVLNLSRALESLCGLHEDSLNPDNCGGESDDCESMNFYRVSANISDRISSQNLVREEDSDLEKLSGNHNKDGRAQLINQFGYDLASNVSASDSDDGDFEHVEPPGGHSDGDDEFNFEFIPRDTEVNDSDESDIPSAYEILEIWKKMKNGVSQHLNR